MAALEGRYNRNLEWAEVVGDSEAEVEADNPDNRNYIVVVAVVEDTRSSYHMEEDAVEDNRNLEVEAAHVPDRVASCSCNNYYIVRTPDFHLV